MSKDILTSPAKGSKNGTPEKKSAGKPPAKKAAATTTIAPSNCVTIRIGPKVTKLAIADLDPSAVRDLAEQLDSGELGTAPVELGIGDYTTARPADRGRFWQLYRAVRGDNARQVTVRVGDRVFVNAVDWATTTLAELPGDPEGRCRALDLTADVLAHACRPADRDVHLDAAVAKLRERGYAAPHCEDIRRNVRQRLRDLGGANAEKNAAGGAGGGSAYQLARLFLHDRYPAADGSQDPVAGDPGPQPAASGSALRYYGESFYRRRTAAWAEATGEDVRLELTSYLQGVAPDRTGVKHVADVLMNVKALCAVRVDDSPPLPFHLGDPDRRLLALRNGLLDLTALARGKKPKLRPHDRDWFSTFSLPYEFAPGADCPRFKAFLGQVLDADPKTLKPLSNGDNRVRVVQEQMGYSLLTDNRFQTFGIYTGRGRNGKGTLFDVWNRMLGPENVSSVPLEAMAREFGTEPLIGKMLNLAGDMNEVDAAAEGTLKTWTGEDRVTVPRKYRSALDVEPTVKFIYGCNRMPWFKDKSDGIWRRVLVVPFKYTPKTPDDIDSRLRPKLRKELPGILNWALAGLARLLEQDGFTPCDVCEAAKAEHREACSPVGEFIGNHFTLASDYAGPKAGKRWTTTTTEIKLLVKDHNAKFGERVIAPNVVCRELSAMKGVSTRRPKTVSGRAEYGTVYCGVCVGEPRQVIPGELDDLAEKTGLDELASGAGTGPTADAAGKPPKKAKKAK